MAKRLDIDSAVVAYWGFDEANETDPAVDEGQYARNLTFAGVNSVVPSRVNNGRSFNGFSTTASPSDSAPFRISGDLTLMAWVNLSLMNSSGSLVRCIMECAGASAGSGDRVQYGLYVSSTGEVVYRHDTTSQIIFKSIPNAVKVGRYHSVAVIRKSGILTLYVDNVFIAWASCTVGGVATDPLAAVAAPTGGDTATFQIGKSLQQSDSAWWNGILDEISVHNTARAYNPYLRSAYFKIALSSTFMRVTMLGNVKGIGTAEMGGGSRWWAYEREQSIYVVRENSLGLFSQEVQITQGVLQPNTMTLPGGASSPKLVYDDTTDTLYVAFLSAGKVYKFTAGSGDPPATQTMPGTADTAGISKMGTTYEVGWIASGPGENVNAAAGATFVNRNPLKINAWSLEPTASIGVGDGFNSKGKPGFPWWGDVSDNVSAPTLYFFSQPSFGLWWTWNWGYGYGVYSWVGGVETRIGTVLTPTQYGVLGGRGFFPITTRRKYVNYFIRTLNRAGRAMTNASNFVQDMLTEMDFYDPGARPTVLGYARDGDPWELAPLASGDGYYQVAPTKVSRTPLKMSGADSFTMNLGSGGGLTLSVGCTYSPTAPQRKGFSL